MLGRTQDLRNGKSKFKAHLHDKITVAGMKEGLAYRIKAVKENFPLKRNGQPPQVGEIIYLKHSFHRETSGSFGYDRMFLHIGRCSELLGGFTIKNFVEYYADLQELEHALGFLEVELAVDLAEKWIIDARIECEAKIAQLKQEYGIECQE